MSVGWSLLSQFVFNFFSLNNFSPKLFCCQTLNFRLKLPPYWIFKTYRPHLLFISYTAAAANAAHFRFPPFFAGNLISRKAFAAFSLGQGMASCLKGKKAHCLAKLLLFGIILFSLLIHGRLFVTFLPRHPVFCFQILNKTLVKLFGMISFCWFSFRIGCLLLKSMGQWGVSFGFCIDGPANYTIPPSRWKKKLGPQ